MHLPAVARYITAAILFSRDFFLHLVFKKIRSKYEEAIPLDGFSTLWTILEEVREKSWKFWHRIRYPVGRFIHY